jgi:hypothetical protein
MKIITCFTLLFYNSTSKTTQNVRIFDIFIQRGTQNEEIHIYFDLPIAKK